MKKICALLTAALLLLTACSALPPSGGTADSTAATTDAPGTTGESTPAETETEPETTQALPKNEIIVWTFDSEVERTRALCEYYLGKPQQPVPPPEGGWTVTVKPVVVEELISRMKEATDTSTMEGLLPDIEEMPDLFFFYSDDFEVLQQAGMLSEVPEKAAASLGKRTVSAALDAAGEGGTLYAYPAALDNTFLLYYDKSVVSETEDLSSVIGQCEAAGRCFYVGSETMSFPAEVFLSCGLNYEATVLPDGRITQVNCDYYTEKGLEAAKMMQSVMSRGAFRAVEGSPVLTFSSEQDRAGAMIAASYLTSELRGILGDDYGVSALPSISDGETSLPLATFGTYVMVGVTPKKDLVKRTVCHGLAEQLVSAEAQTARFEEAGIIPVSTPALNKIDTEDNETASALAAQTPYTMRKIRVSEGYYEAMERFTAKLLAGGASMKTAKLQQMLDELSAFLMADVSKE